MVRAEGVHYIQDFEISGDGSMRVFETKGYHSKLLNWMKVDCREVSGVIITVHKRQLLLSDCQREVFKAVKS